MWTKMQFMSIVENAYQNHLILLEIWKHMYAFCSIEISSVITYFEWSKNFDTYYLLHDNKNHPGRCLKP